jgi:hypothetical protein
MKNIDQGIEGVNDKEGKKVKGNHTTRKIYFGRHHHLNSQIVSLYRLSKEPLSGCKSSEGNNLGRQRSSCC